MHLWHNMLCRARSNDAEHEILLLSMFCCRKERGLFLSGSCETYINPKSLKNLLEASYVFILCRYDIPASAPT